MRKFIFSAVLCTAVALTGCANLPKLPQQQIVAVQTATIFEAKPVVVSSSTPSVGGAVAGGLAGGVLGNKVGKGNGKKLATVLGAVAGAAAGAQVASTTTSTRGTQVSMRDDATGEIITVALAGEWTPGMQVRYSKEGGKIVLR